MVVLVVVAVLLLPPLGILGKPPQRVSFGTLGVVGGVVMDVLVTVVVVVVLEAMDWNVRVLHVLLFQKGDSIDIAPAPFAPSNSWWSPLSLPALLSESSLASALNTCACDLGGGCLVILNLESGDCLRRRTSFFRTSIMMVFALLDDRNLDVVPGVSSGAW